MHGGCRQAYKIKNIHITLAFIYKQIYTKHLWAVTPILYTATLFSSFMDMSPSGKVLFKNLTWSCYNLIIEVNSFHILSLLWSPWVLLPHSCFRRFVPSLASGPAPHPRPSTYDICQGVRCWWSRRAEEAPGVDIWLIVTGLESLSALKKFFKDCKRSHLNANGDGKLNGREILPCLRLVF